MIPQLIYDQGRENTIQSPCKHEISIPFSFNCVYVISYFFCQPFNESLVFARMMWKERAIEINPKKFAWKHSILYD